MLKWLLILILICFVALMVMQVQNQGQYGGYVTLGSTLSMPVQEGLVVKAYGIDPDLKPTELIATDSHREPIDFTWGNKDISYANSRYAILEFRGFIRAPKSGTNTYTIYYTDGIELTIGGNTRSSWNKTNQKMSQTITINMVKDKFYPIQLKWFTYDNNDAMLRLKWLDDSNNMSIVPASDFYIIPPSSSETEEVVNVPGSGFTPATVPGSGFTPATDPGSGFTPATGPGPGITPATVPAHVPGPDFTPATGPGSGFTPATVPGSVFTPATDPESGFTSATDPESGFTPATVPGSESVPVSVPVPGYDNVPASVNGNSPPPYGNGTVTASEHDSTVLVHPPMSSPIGYGPGLKSIAYHSNKKGDQLEFINEDIYHGPIDFNWGTGTVYNTSLTRDVLLDFSGYIRAPKSGNWLFHTQISDGVWLSVNNKNIISRWGLQGPLNFPEDANIKMTKGNFYPIHLRWYGHNVGGILKLTWFDPVNKKWSLVPANVFYQQPMVSMLQEETSQVKQEEEEAEIVQRKLESNVKSLKEINNKLTQSGYINKTDGKIINKVNTNIIDLETRLDNLLNQIKTHQKQLELKLVKLSEEQEYLGKMRTFSEVHGDNPGASKLLDSKDNMAFTHGVLSSHMQRLYSIENKLIVIKNTLNHVKKMLQDVKLKLQIV